MPRFEDRHNSLDSWLQNDRPLGHERRSVSARDGSRRPPKNGNSGRQSRSWAGHPCTYCVSADHYLHGEPSTHLRRRKDTPGDHVWAHETNRYRCCAARTMPPPRTSSGLGRSSRGFPAGGVGVLAILHQCAKKDAENTRRKIQRSSRTWEDATPQRLTP